MASVKRSAPLEKPDASVAGIHLTHPDRIYWQDAGITKHDLADYYVQVWKWMRPHLVGRPISLLRCPEGAEGQCFFQKHARAGIPAEHLHLVSEKGDKIISVDDLDGVIALVQGGVLEIHTAEQPSTIASVPTGWYSISTQVPALAGKMSSLRRATCGGGWRPSSSRAS